MTDNSIPQIMSKAHNLLRSSIENTVCYRYIQGSGQIKKDMHSVLQLN